MKDAKPRKPGIGRGEHQNVARAALVIEALSRARERGLRLTDVIRETGLGTATIHRLLSGLVAHGFVDHDPRDNRYFIGLRMVTWAVAATDRYGLAPYVNESLEALRIETEDTVYFSLVSGVDAVCVDRREGDYPIKTLTLRVGDRRPLGVGAGSMALLAFQDQRFVESILETDEPRRLAFGIETDFLRAELAKARERGFALNDGRLIAGMNGVAVPIRDRAGHAIAAFSVAAVSSRLSGERLDLVVEWLRREAARVERVAADVLNSPLMRRFSNMTSD